ncbi:MAG: DNA translocase FtsK 4TM domain-containing protein [Akkermansiaceae bacterium]|nr:DNA translocase FtsK 4TM domain-containing protein [Akkermansiaceae bacterium]MCP5545712.1 DNA translocase FtsK 4TM domain-containing protein [Akkermansiaceae bacterium]MCP5546701.1 DNA translocase FtsK 4TM domain-containing protein [Akkermansiaceae bacterium]
MAGKDNKKRGEVAEPSRWTNEIIGILWITGGLLLLLSLVRYSPADLPKWGLLEAFASKNGEAGQNLIGPVGGILGFIQVLLFGAASFMVPVGFIWFGVVKLAFDGRLWPRTVIGFAILLFSGAAFLHAANWFFVDWANRCNLNSPGGVMGAGLGGFVLMSLIGKVGTLLVAGAAYLVAVILLTGQQPIRFAKACGRLVVLKFKAWRERKVAVETAAQRESELIAEREKQRELRRKEREAAKAATKPAEDEDGQSQLPLRETPAPQIIDASQRRAAEAVAPGAKPFERKKPAHQFLSVTGFENYELPGFDLLDEEEAPEAPEANRDELLGTQRTIIETLAAFGIEVTPGDITRGPTITRYEIYPSTGLRVSRIAQLEADIARATRAERINILAPIPGKDTVGIEIANSQKVAVPLHELLHDPEFRSAKKRIPLALGKDVYGKTVIGDLAAMPHLLVAGATGSGKSVCINSIIASMLFKFGPDELRFIMVDPKVVEMQMYNKLPHLVVPVVTDPKKTVAALKWVVNEMEKRYRIFAKEGVRNFDSFNNRPRPDKEPEPEEEKPEEEEEVDEAAIEEIAAALESGDLGPEMSEEEEADLFEEKVPDRFPYIVVLIDELADLMQTAPADVEMNIARIAQKARAAGIHLIIATQTPRADVVTGIIKANIPCRIAFQVSSQLDSRVILDTKGAEKLVGKGDMLYLPPGSAKLERAQGAFVTDEEVERIIAHCAAQGEPQFETDIHASLESAADDDEEDISDADEELIMKCIDVARQEQKCSTSLLQRRLRLGYTRAARMVDILEARGIVGPGDGAKPREVFVK